MVICGYTRQLLGECVCVCSASFMHSLRLVGLLTRCSSSISSVFPGHCRGVGPGDF